MDPAHWSENWRAEQAIFLLSRPPVGEPPPKAADDLFGR
jgi:hypothetical protein